MIYPIKIHWDKDQGPTNPAHPQFLYYQALMDRESRVQEIFNDKPIEYAFTDMPLDMFEQMLDDLTVERGDFYD